MTYALRCRLRAGAFSGEKVYSLTLADGTVWKSLVSAPHCWHQDWRPVAESEPTEEIDALVECKVMMRMDPVTGGMLVAAPCHCDTEYVFVKLETIIQRPQETLDELLARRAGVR